MSAKQDVELVQVESDASIDTALPAAVHGQHRGRSVVQSVRLPEDDFADIQKIAAQHDIPVGALIRGWVLAGLADERGTSLAGAIEKLAGDADRLRRLAATSGVA
jgi:hypothetical protein